MCCYKTFTFADACVAVVVAAGTTAVLVGFVAVADPTASPFAPVVAVFMVTTFFAPSCSFSMTVCPATVVGLFVAASVCSPFAPLLVVFMVVPGCLPFAPLLVVFTVVSDAPA